MMIQMTVEGIGIDPQNNTLVLLRDEDQKVYVPIYIGPAEAMSIQMELDEKQPPRPMTHDLISNIFRDLGVQLVKVTVNDVDKLLYYASLHLQNGNGDVQEVDARPSDAIALALRAQCSIFVSDKVVTKSGIQVEEVTNDSGEVTAFRAAEERPIPMQQRPLEAAERTAEKLSAEELRKLSKLLEGIDLSGKDD